MNTDISALTSEAVALLQSLIAIPSVSRDEAQAADCLQRYIELQGMDTGRRGNNVWCLSPAFDLKKPTLLLNSHIDTVKPVSGWRRDPFAPRLEANGKLYGLGSNDAAIISCFWLRARRRSPARTASRASCPSCRPSPLPWWASPPRCSPPSPRRA